MATYNAKTGKVTLDNGTSLSQAEIEALSNLLAVRPTTTNGNTVWGTSVTKPTYSLGDRSENYFRPGEYANGSDFANTEVIAGANGYLENNPQAVYTRFLANNGIGLQRNDAYADYARNQYNATRSGYEAALADSPNLLYQNYVNGLGGNAALRRQFNSLTPSQRKTSQRGPVRTIADL